MGLDSVEIILATENSFRITISDKEVAKIYTVGDLYELILLKLNANDIDKQIWDKLVRIISHQTSHPPSKIRPESHFVDDLGVD